MKNVEPEKDAKSLKRDSDYLQILAEHLESGVSILDADRNFLFMSESLSRYMGTAEDELKVGDPLSKCHQMMLESGMVTPEVIQNQSQPSSEQVQIDEFGVLKTSSVIAMGNGETHRFIRKNFPCGKLMTIVQDVSELVEKEQLLGKALILGRSGYWSFDVKTKSYTLSPSLHSYLKAEEIEKIKTQGILAIMHPEDRHLFKSSLANSSKTGNKFEVTIRILPEIRKDHWWTTTGEVIRDANGKAIRIDAFVKDVTQEHRKANELKHAKDQAISASKAKSEFLANMSHEIRTPMNGILGMAELLENSDINDRQREFVSVINSSASALLTIINDILDFSKIEAGAFAIDPVPFDLKSSINDVTSLLQKSAQEKGVELIINYPSDLPKAFIGDAGRIRQVITNLLGNAVKFTEVGHVSIDVDIQLAGDLAVCNVEVTDTGIGISPEKMNRIFDEFTQADGSTTRVYGGTGLGLTISKHIIEMMGGRMRVQSKLGEGSSFGFRVSLPVDENAKSEAFDISLVQNKRVLIVDDIQFNRHLFSEQLAVWGLQTETAIDGVDALSKIRVAQESGHPFDLVLLDFLMPGMNGQEFAQLVTKSNNMNAPQMIMLSSCDQPVSTAALIEMGIDSYLMKPVRERRLFDTIVRVLSNPVLREKEQASSKLVHEHRHADAATRKQKTEILVAEDFALNRDVVKLMLSETVFEPIFVHNGQEAVDKYKEDPSRFPVIVMDVSMPVLDGYSATKAIREFERTEKLGPIAIIALTGHALKNDREECLESGMDDYLSKPVKQGELIGKLETYSGKAIDMRRSA